MIAEYAIEQGDSGGRIRLCSCLEIRVHHAVSLKHVSVDSIAIVLQTAVEDTPAVSLLLGEKKTVFYSIFSMERAHMCSFNFE